MAIEILIISIALIALAFVVIILTNLQTSFLYANARTVVRAQHILDKGKLKGLLFVKSLDELINHLKNTEYHEFLKDIDKSSILEFEMALEKGFINSLEDVRKISPKKFQVIFDVYTKLYEAKIIKTFFRSRFSKVDIDIRLLEPIGIINPVLLKHLHDAKTIADLRVVLRDTPYKDIIEKEFSSIEEFDVAIEQQIMKDISIILKNLKTPDKKSIIESFEVRAELRNILMLLKFRIRGLDKETQKKLIKSKLFDIHKIVEAKDMQDFVKEFGSSQFFEPLSNALQEFQGTYYCFERALLRYYLDFVNSKDLNHPIGPYPIISYLIKKEFERKNLLIIAKGIISELEKNELEKMLI